MPNVNTGCRHWATKRQLAFSTDVTSLNYWYFTEVINASLRNIGFCQWLKLYPTSGKNTSQKHAYIILTTKTPLLYNKTGVYREYTLFFLFLLKNIDCGYSLEPPRRGGSNEYPQSMFWTEIWIRIFIWKLSVLGGEISNTYEYACFRNAKLQHCRLQ